MTPDLNAIWFALVGLLLTGYAVLDGFDLGAGVLYLFSKTEEERAILRNSIGPLWGGNEVWLVAGGGAFFAAFPRAYATVFSGFYLAFILFLFALIFRAVSLEFRSKQPMAWWKRLWDAGFAASSVLAAFLLGVVGGNLVWGIPLAGDGEYAGTLLGAIHPFSILSGLATVAIFTVHGGNYLMMRTDGAVREGLRKRTEKNFWIFLFCYAVLAAGAAFFVPHMRGVFKKYPILGLILLSNAVAVAAVYLESKRGRDLNAFLSSCAVISTLAMILAAGTFPHLVFSLPRPEWSLTVYNASSSPKTLSIMLLIAAIGMPLAAGYTAFVYWVFRGKTRSNREIY